MKMRAVRFHLDLEIHSKILNQISKVHPLIATMRVVNLTSKQAQNL